MESKSFLELKSFNDEFFEDYLIRIRKNSKFNHIQEEILEHFIYGLFDEPYIINNYSSIDFYRARFVLKELTISEVLSLPVLSHKEEYVSSKSRHKSLETMVFNPFSGDKEN